MLITAMVDNGQARVVLLWRVADMPLGRFILSNMTRCCSSLPGNQWELMFAVAPTCIQMPTMVRQCQAVSRTMAYLAQSRLLLISLATITCMQSQGQIFLRNLYNLRLHQTAGREGTVADRALNTDR